MTSTSFKATFFILAALVTVASAAKTTPIERVVVLLKDLSTKIAAEGQKEAAQYDKYACFCKEQADEKQYAIDQSKSKIEYLQAEIGELNAAKKELEGDMMDLAKKITGLEGDITLATDNRFKAHNKYLKTAQDQNEAIDACGAAIDALKNSKSSMKGAKVDLVQVTSTLVKKIKEQPSLTAAAGAASLLDEVDEGAPKFEYQSNDIIATLEDLQKSFNSIKYDLDIDEHKANSQFEHKKLGLQNEAKFAEKLKNEKEAQADAKEEALQAASKDKDDAVGDITDDKAYRTQLSEDCNEKAKLFDQRSDTRVSELTALSEATKELESGAVGNFKANKKLVGLQIEKKGGFPVSSPVKLVQISSIQHQAARSDEVMQRIENVLSQAADNTGSPVLAAIAVRIGVAARRTVGQNGEKIDHFVKVRGLIKDLMSKLKDDARSEATQKEDCVKGIKTATKDRDDANGNLEVATAKLTVATSNKNTLQEDKQKFTVQIAEEKKAKLEAQELFDTDEASMKDQRDLAKDGAASVAKAISVLESFYSEAFVQVSKKKQEPQDDDYKSSAADLNDADARLGDDAPAVFESTYHGAQSESKGIIGILEVLHDDFKRTERTVIADLKDATDAIAAMITESDASTKKKGESIDKIDLAIAEADAAILGEEQSQIDANKILKSAHEALEGWHEMCVKGEETWEERAAKRKDEIGALKEAMEILNDWQGL